MKSDSPPKGFYINQDDGVVNATRPAADWQEAITQFDKRFMKKTQVGPYRVSTVFLGVSYSTRPQLWETMVFDGDGADIHCTRDDTKREALLTHDRVVEIYRLKLATSTQPESITRNQMKPQ